MFKRALQRYGATPEPVTPYQKAAQAWDQRIGAARVQAPVPKRPVITMVFRSGSW